MERPCEARKPVQRTLYRDDGAIRQLLRLTSAWSEGRVVSRVTRLAIVLATLRRCARTGPGGRLDDRSIRSLEPEPDERIATHAHRAQNRPCFPVGTRFPDQVSPAPA
jgi:hypothetical protein